ncbi:MAG TPA: C-GCAxxG-C-C family protein [Anaeromyxobacter sp.]
MSDTLGRRSLLSRAGLALGGAVALGSMHACSDSKDTTTPTPEPQPQVNQFPYQQFVPASYQLDTAAVKEAAYHGYYAGGCCHGAYSALVKHLADTVGAPFDQLPLDFGMFGGGGIASYGSICGAALAGVLVVNSIVPNLGTATLPDAQKNARNRMMTELLRWYEQFAFPAYAPAAVDAAETGLTLAFDGKAGTAAQRIVPRSHLCHASVTGWCAANGNVPAGGADKKARCARLTADVAGKVADLLNAYLPNREFTAATASLNADCTGCHTAAAVAPAAPVASGMECKTCHPAASHPFPSTIPHDPASSCDGCH